MNRELIRLPLSSVADTAMIPLQDILEIGSESRMNTPGQTSDNWGWRYSQNMLNTTVCQRLKVPTEIYGRATRKKEKVSRFDIQYQG